MLDARSLNDDHAFHGVPKDWAWKFKRLERLGELGENLFQPLSTLQSWIKAPYKEIMVRRCYTAIFLCNLMILKHEELKATILSIKGIIYTMYLIIRPHGSYVDLSHIAAPGLMEDVPQVDISINDSAPIANESVGPAVIGALVNQPVNEGAPIANVSVGGGGVNGAWVNQPVNEGGVGDTVVEGGVDVVVDDDVVGATIDGFVGVVINEGTPIANAESFSVCATVMV
ncbi:hypothetical protein LguiB_005685 [Lonicera macranthoides]